MGPIPASVHALCAGLREVSAECNRIAESSPTEVAALNQSARTVIEYPVFAAELLLIQLRHPAIAQPLELIKEHRAHSPTLVFSESTLRTLVPVLSHLNDTDVMYYDTSSTNFRSTSTTLLESDPIEIVHGVGVTKTIATVVEATPANEAILRTKAKLSMVHSTRSIQLQLQEILKSPLFSFKHKFRSLSRTHFRTSSI